MTERNARGWVLAGVGLILVALGVWRGELREVFLKAAVICLECMGLR